MPGLVLSPDDAACSLAVCRTVLHGRSALPPFTHPILPPHSGFFPTPPHPSPSHFAGRHKAGHIGARGRHVPPAHEALRDA